MNLFVIPSWYPSTASPSTGIFFREQSLLMARYRPDYSIGICLWGSHEPKLWLKGSRPLHALLQYASRPPVKANQTLLEPNCIEFFHPAYTWTRKVRKGNIKGIIDACEKNFMFHRAYFGRPDLIHAHVSYPAGYIAKTLSEKFNIPYLITEHMSPFPMTSFRRSWRQLLLPPLLGAAGVLAVSRALADQLARYGIDAQVSSNFIDDAFFVPGKTGEGVFTFLSVGRLEKQKGFEYLLKAVKLMKNEGLDFRVKILGRGTLENTLRNETRRQALTEVIEWPGEASRETVLNELQSADAFVLPSLHENQPVAILEAMACGLPVVTTDWKGSKELIDPETGVIVSKKDPLKLADGMKQIMFSGISKEVVRRSFDLRFRTMDQVEALHRIYTDLPDRS